MSYNLTTTRLEATVGVGGTIAICLCFLSTVPSKMRDVDIAYVNSAERGCRG
jgi:hypothetical protein